MCSDDHFLTGSNAWFDNISPVRHNAVDSDRQALSGRQFAFCQFRITRIVAREALITFFQCRRGDGKAATPQFDLLVTVFCSGFRFIQTLECAVMTFVQFPAFLNRQPLLVYLIQDIPQCVNSAFQYRGIGEIKREAFFFE